jgi:hypothetical protein
VHDFGALEFSPAPPEISLFALRYENSRITIFRSPQPAEIFA